MSDHQSKRDHPNNAPGVPMVYPPRFERLQIKYINPWSSRSRELMPGGAIKHRGRKSGKTYETIVTPYRKGTTLAIALGHGKTDWVKNVLAADEADVHLIRRAPSPRQPPDPARGQRRRRRPAVHGPPQAKRVGIFVADIA